MNPTTEVVISQGVGGGGKCFRRAKNENKMSVVV